jgi:hypothetical protein
VSFLESIRAIFRRKPVPPAREPDPPPPVDERPSERRRRNLRTTWNVLVSWVAVSLFALILYGVFAQPDKALRFVSAAALAAAASASVGALLGFLFGIPRSLQQDSAAPRPAPASSSPSPTPRPTDEQSSTAGLPAPPAPLPSASTTRANHLGVNTNLEQISDWLTKILVGVGLTQLQHLWPNLVGLATFLQPALNGSVELAMVCILNFAIWGFFMAYLVTRLFLAEAFGLADAANEQATRLEHEAFVLTQRGQHIEAAALYDAVLQQLPSDASPEQVRRAVEGKVYNALYETAPRGFQRAIQVARQYLSDSTRTASGKLWAYLAMAYGQQYEFEREHDASPARLLAIRSNVLDAVRQAITISPEKRSLLRSVWDPHDPNKASEKEDDLEIFFDDPEFSRLLQ